MSLLHFLRDMWRALVVPAPLRPRCNCDDPRLNEIGGYKTGCPVHDQAAADV